TRAAFGRVGQGGAGGLRVCLFRGDGGDVLCRVFDGRGKAGQVFRHAGKLRVQAAVLFAQIVQRAFGGARRLAGGVLRVKRFGTAGFRRFRRRAGGIQRGLFLRDVLFKLRQAVFLLQANGGRVFGIRRNHQPVPAPCPALTRDQRLA